MTPTPARCERSRPALPGLGRGGLEGGEVVPLAPDDLAVVGLVDGPGDLVEVVGDPEQAELIARDLASSRLIRGALIISDLPYISLIGLVCTSLGVKQSSSKQVRTQDPLSTRAPLSEDGFQPIFLPVCLLCPPATGGIVD